MMHLVSGVYDSLFHVEEQKILIVGCQDSGKTTLLEHLKLLLSKSPKEEIPLAARRVIPTVGLNVARLSLDQVHLVVWDLGGQPSLRPLWGNYFKQCDGMIFVVDASNSNSVVDAKEVLKSILLHPSLTSIPVSVVANKTDHSSCMRAAEIQETLELVDVAVNERLYCNRITEQCDVSLCGGVSGAGARLFKIHLCSALTGANIVPALRWLSSAIAMSKAAKTVA